MAFAYPLRMPVVRRAALRTLAAITAGTATAPSRTGTVGTHDLQLVRRTSGSGPGFDGPRIGFSQTSTSASSFPEDIQRARAHRRRAPGTARPGGDYVHQDMAWNRWQSCCRGARALGVIAILGITMTTASSPPRSAGGASPPSGCAHPADTGGASNTAGLRFWTKTADDVARIVAGARGPVLLLADPGGDRGPRSAFRPCCRATHGGQVVLPGLGALRPKFPVAAGRLSMKGTELYVSAGVGTVILPVRINCPPEVALVTLRRVPDLES